MDFGVAMFQTSQAISPDVLGQLAEERGFESLWFPEHSHIPLSRDSPWPAGGDLDPKYGQTYDPMVTLGAVAMCTDRIKIGTGICLVTERDPIHLAKEVATIDHLSNGRMLFGVSSGWNIEEMANHGTNPHTRWSLMRERIEAIKTIWTEDEPSYDGRYVNFGPMWCAPKPVQDPHPPILVGGNGAKVLDRVLAYGDAWIPNRVSEYKSVEEGDEGLLVRVRELQRRAADEGRASVPVTMFPVNEYPIEKPPASIEDWVEAGITRFCFLLPTAPREMVEPLLDEIAATTVRLSRGLGG